MSLKRTQKLFSKNLRIASGYLDLKIFLNKSTSSKILINSVPKSGTNMVQELVQLFPGIRGTFRRTVHGEPDLKSMKFVSRISSGSCATSHLFHTEALQNTIVANDIATLHVVRDFRDSLLSQVNFLHTLGKSHPHGNLYSDSSSFDEKLEICLYGVSGVMKGWVEILPRFAGWQSSGALIVKYEDLYADLYTCEINSNLSEINRIAKFLDIDVFETDKIIAKVTNKNSLTYNSPGVEKWKSILNEDQKRMVNNLLGDQLSLFGYDV